MHIQIDIEELAQMFLRTCKSWIETHGTEDFVKHAGDNSVALFELYRHPNTTIEHIPEAGGGQKPNDNPF